MVAAGVLHFVIPTSYQRIVPRALGHARTLVAVTGVVEIVAGVLVAIPRTRRLGAWLTLVLLVVVWPANVQMALDGGVAGAGFPAGSALLSWLRVPLQLPLFVWAYRQTRPGPTPAPVSRPLSAG
ncbi:MAG TPA: hypothetical protein VHT97_15440 [Acidimicrobiales bacterium]|jgi:uncharacterized membrane protein|nr:hypothetical protein [Acidimicrobiales bacterium]